MKWLTVAAISIALLGCRADQERQAARCQLEGQKTYPNVETMYLSVPAGDFIEMCMKAAGYDFDYDDRNCSAPYIAPNGSVVSERPNAYSYCYVPNTKWERVGQKLENWFRGEKPLG